MINTEEHGQTEKTNLNLKKLKTVLCENLPLDDLYPSAGYIHIKVLQKGAGPYAIVQNPINVSNIK